MPAGEPRGLGGLPGWASDDALGEHGVGYLEESSDVGSFDVIDVSVRFLAILEAGLVEEGRLLTILSARFGLPVISLKER